MSRGNQDEQKDSGFSLVEMVFEMPVMNSKAALSTDDASGDGIDDSKPGG